MPRPPTSPVPPDPRFGAKPKESVSDSVATLDASEEIKAAVRRVFAPRPDDRRLALLIDQPDLTQSDRPEWLDRRRLALEWRDVDFGDATIQIRRSKNKRPRILRMSARLKRALAAHAFDLFRGINPFKIP